jgi:hypothetical protein
VTTACATAAPDEVPKLQAPHCRRAACRSGDLDHPDEQEAIDAALNMGQPGDLLLIFADALIALVEADHQVPDGDRAQRVGVLCSTARARPESLGPSARRAA